MAKHRSVSRSIALRVLHALRSQTYAVTESLGSPLAYRIADHLVALGYAKRFRNGRYSVTAAGITLLKASGLYFVR